jgi:hypothetical protein
MIRWKRAARLGVLSWLIPFAISFLLLPVKQINAPLFATLMMLATLLTAGALFRLYFRGHAVAPGEAVLLGTLWLALSLVFDYPMFAYGPMKMTAGAYYSEIGLAYLVFPCFALGAARLVRA